MPSSVISDNVLVSSAQSYTDSDADLNAWLTVVKPLNGSPGSLVQALLHDLITGLKTDGLWTKLDRLWIFAQGTMSGALVDFVARSLATAVGTPTFTTNRGFISNGSAYINSLYTPSVNGVNFTLNSASVGCWVNNSRTVPTNNAAGISGQDATNSCQVAPLCIFGATGELYQINNGTLEIWTIPSDAQGFNFASRTASNLTTMYKNNTVGATGAGVSAGLPTQPLYICAQNNNGAPQNWNALDTISCAVMGAGLNATDEGNLYARLRTYMTAVGVP
jgi:hypothetical protein